MFCPNKKRSLEPFYVFGSCPKSVIISVEFVVVAACNLFVFLLSFVDLVKRGVLTLVGQISRFGNNSY